MSIVLLKRFVLSIGKKFSWRRQLTVKRQMIRNWFAYFNHLNEFQWFSFIASVENVNVLFHCSLNFEHEFWTHWTNRPFIQITEIQNERAIMSHHYLSIESVLRKISVIFWPLLSPYIFKVFHMCKCNIFCQYEYIFFL